VNFKSHEGKSNFFRLYMSDITLNRTPIKAQTAYIFVLNVYVLRPKRQIAIRIFARKSGLYLIQKKEKHPERW